MSYRPSDGTKNDCIGIFGCCERLVGQWGASNIDGGLELRVNQRTKLGDVNAYSPRQEGGLGTRILYSIAPVQRL
jgi:hypothetical protein